MIPFYYRNLLPTSIRTFLPGVILVLLLSSCNTKTGTAGSASPAADQILRKANELYDGGKHAEAIRFLNASAKNTQHLTVPQAIDRLNIYCAYYYHVQNNHAAAMRYIDSMEMIFNTDARRKTYPALYGKIFFYKGDLLFDENKFIEAYYLYYQGKRLSKATLDSCTFSDYTYRMGMIMYKQEHFLQAASFFKESFAETGTCEINFRSFYRRQELLSNTGLSYAAAGKPDSAIYYYNKTLVYIDSYAKTNNSIKNQYERARGVVYGNLAGVYFKQQKLAQAAALFKKSIAINLQKGNDNLDAEFTEVKLAKLYQSQHKLDPSFVVLQSLQKQLVTVPNITAEVSLNSLLADYYTAKPDFKQALKYYKAYIVLKDSLDISRQALKTIDVNELIKRYENDTELTSLKENNDAQHKYLLAAILAGVVLLTLMLLIYKYWNKSKRNIILLDGLNKQISTQNNDLENALEELKTNNQEKDRILRTVAHDLRNPIGGIASLSGMVFDDSECSEEQLELVKMIKDTANDSLVLIHELLEVTNDQPEMAHRRMIDVNALASSCVDLLAYKSAEKSQHINFTGLSQPKEVPMVREKIWRVLSNLITNAIKFSEVNSEIEVRVKQLNQYVQVSVHDCGIGIPEAMKPKIFNMFTEAKRPGTLNEKSFGLGLSICKQIIDQHQGKIWFTSQPDEGTTFYFTLPLQ